MFLSPEWEYRSIVVSSGRSSQRKVLLDTRLLSAPLPLRAFFESSVFTLSRMYIRFTMREVHCRELLPCGTSRSRKIHHCRRAGLGWAENRTLQNTSLFNYSWSRSIMLGLFSSSLPFLFFSSLPFALNKMDERRQEDLLHLQMGEEWGGGVYTPLTLTFMPPPCLLQNCVCVSHILLNKGIPSTMYIVEILHVVYNIPDH